MVLAVVATKSFVHPSIANAGMGKMVFVFSIPLMCLALVAGAAASRGLSSGLRRASMVGAILLACGVMTLVRTGGVTGDAASELHWRWTPTPEERLLAQAADEPLTPSPAPPAAETPAQPVPPPASAVPTAAASAPPTTQAADTP